MNRNSFKQPDVPDFIQKIFLNQKNFQKILDGFGGQKILDGLDNFSESPEEKPITDAMLTKEVFRKIVSKLNFELPTVQETVFVQEYQESKKPDYLITEKRCSRFKPQINDSIFWCMFVHANGESLYQTKLHMKTNMTNLMMCEKKLMSDYFNKIDNKILKNTNHKITLTTAVELKSDLMTKPYMMNYSALISCCLFFKCPIYVINETTKTYIVFQPNEYVCDTDNVADDPNIVVLYSEKGRVSMEMDKNEKTIVINSLLAGDKYFKIEQYDKPLMSISNYKTEELQSIYNLLFGDCPKLKKQEYYEKIVERCCVHILEKLI